MGRKSKGENRMKILTGAIGSGKTYQLLKRCNEAGGIYVTEGMGYKLCAQDIIERAGFYNIQKVISFREYLNLYGVEKNKDKFFFDIDGLFKDEDTIALTCTDTVTLVEKKPVDRFEYITSIIYDIEQVKRRTW
jgi:hypothetical protein